MRFLFLAVLMIGVGVGLVGCEDENGGASEEEEVVEETGADRNNVDQELISFSGTVFHLISGPDDATSNVGSSSDEFTIAGDNGTNYAAGDSLPIEYRVSQLRVWVRAEDLSLGGQVDPVPIRIVEIGRL